MKLKEQTFNFLSGFSCVLISLYAYYLVFFYASKAYGESSWLELLKFAGMDFFFLSGLFFALAALCLCLQLAGFKLLAKAIGIAGVFIPFVWIGAEFMFYAKTGGYFSFLLAAHALGNWLDMRKVLQTGFDFSGVLSFLAMPVFLLGGWAASKFYKARRCCFYVVVLFVTLSVSLTVSSKVMDDDAEIEVFEEQGMFASFWEGGFWNGEFLNREWWSGEEAKALLNDETYSANGFEIRKDKRSRLPNIIIFISESTRADAIPGFSGSGRKVPAPAAQWLQSRGISYDRAYTTLPHTSKALVGLLCGIPPAPYYNIVEATPGGIPVKCLPEILGDLGYQSLYMQSATIDFEDRKQMVKNMGFDTLLSKENIGKGFQSSGYFGVDEMAMLKPFMNWWSSVSSGNPEQKGGRLAVILTSMTHHPYQEIGQAEPETLTQAKDAYYRNLSYTDSVLGSLIEGLRSLGDLENTIIVFTGDHGEAFGEHKVYIHDAVPFEEGIRSPLILFDGRKQEEGRISDSLHQHIDIVPTLLEKIGVTYDGKFPGKSLDSPEGHEQIIATCWGVENCKALVQKDLKWIFYPSSGKLLAFSLAQDPDETENIAGKYPDAERKRIVSILKSWTSGTTRLYAGEADKMEAQSRSEARKSDRRSWESQMRMDSGKAEKLLK
ncbi:hypothetical protein FACS1894158_06560 [Betaproteobacteria bacterium]|nr:hypothetical protein FACS1894158_06560 [Betaproteobacteria bacterium]